MIKALFLLAAASAAPALPTRPANQAVETAVLARPVQKGEILGAADFVLAALPAAQARSAVAPADAAGLEAVRNLAPGAAVRVTDLIRPQLVRRGEPVTILVRSGGLSITAQGRALTGGASGEMVRVVNAATNRTLEGQVEKAGTVRITAP